MAVVNHKVTLLDGATGRTGVKWFVRLMNQATKSPVQGMGATTGAVGLLEGETDSTGNVALTLQANSAITVPATTYYEITFTIPGELPDVQTFQVPSGAGPFQLSAILYTPP